MPYLSSRWTVLLPKMVTNQTLHRPSPRRSARAKTIWRSEHASPLGVITGRRSWTWDCPCWLTSKPTRNASVSNGLATGSTMSARSAVGLGKMSACTKKSNDASASRTRALVPVRHDQVGVDVDQRPCPVGPVPEDRGVEVVAGYELEPCRTLRTLAHTDGPGTPFVAEQVHAVDGGSSVPA